ncbi:hypothetical protein ACVNPX_11395 [Staphylococcus aureus]
MLQLKIFHTVSAVDEINTDCPEPFTVEFEKIKEYDALTKFVIAGQKMDGFHLKLKKKTQVTN